MSAFSADNITCQRGQQVLFSNLSFSLQAGNALLIQGQNGIGKSSLLRLLAGLATPEEGIVQWCGDSISQHPTYFDHMHYVGHANGVKLGLTVKENILLMCRLSGSTVQSLRIRAKQAMKQSNLPFGSPRLLTQPRDDESVIDEVLQKLTLHNHQHTLAKELSAGQRRRIALAKLWLFPKKLWILDEPLTSLDIDTQKLLTEKMDTHLEQGGMLIVSSHQPVNVKSTMQTLRMKSC